MLTFHLFVENLSSGKENVNQDRTLVNDSLLRERSNDVITKENSFSKLKESR